MAAARGCARRRASSALGRCARGAASRSSRAMSHANGWPALFSSAFRQSRNAMVLLDEQRRIVDVNAAMVAAHRAHARRGCSAGRSSRSSSAARSPPRREWQRADGRRALHRARRRCGMPTAAAVTVQWGATTEVVTGRRLVLFVALQHVALGRALPPRARRRRPARRCPAREREVVRLVALGHTGPEIADELRHHARHRPHARPQRDGEASAPARAPISWRRRSATSCSRPPGR